MPIKDYDGTAFNEIKKITDYDGTAHNAIGKVCDYDCTAYKLIYSAEETLPNLSGFAASAGSPDASEKSYALTVNSDSSWDLTGFSTIDYISGYASPAMAYWTGGAYIQGQKTIYLVFADGSMKPVVRWSYEYNYYDGPRGNDWTALNVDISGYTNAQKKNVKLRYVNSVYCKDNYGAYFTELSFNTSKVIAS